MTLQTNEAAFIFICILQIMQYSSSVGFMLILYGKHLQGKLTVPLYKSYKIYKEQLCKNSSFCSCSKLTGRIIVVSVIILFQLHSYQLDNDNS